jgi:hypothetical protein
MTSVYYFFTVYIDLVNHYILGLDDEEEESEEEEDDDEDEEDDDDEDENSESENSDNENQLSQLAPASTNIAPASGIPEKKPSKPSTSSVSGKSSATSGRDAKGISR